MLLRAPAALFSKIAAQLIASVGAEWLTLVGIDRLEAQKKQQHPGHHQVYMYIDLRIFLFPDLAMRYFCLTVSWHMRFPIYPSTPEQ